MDFCEITESECENHEQRVTQMVTKRVYVQLCHLQLLCPFVTKSV